jgi:tryptophan synthase alpha chain
VTSVSRVFAENKSANKETLIGYFPAGYPNLEASLEACQAMCENGIDILELGVPYSDPVMDGAVIQAATEQALQAGFKLKELFPLLAELTSKVDTPVLVMTYWNPVVQYGIERFARDLKAAGGAGLITPDLIVDEAGEWLRISDELGLDRVFLATPSSSQERINKVVEVSRGFVYTVSTMGITGARDDLDAKARSVVKKIRQASSGQNTAVGIGISLRSQVAEVNEYADGAIVGSVFVRAFANGGVSELVEQTKKLSQQD